MGRSPSSVPAEDVVQSIPRSLTSARAKASPPWASGRRCPCTRTARGHTSVAGVDRVVSPAHDPFPDDGRHTDGNPPMQWRAPTRSEPLPDAQMEALSGNDAPSERLTPFDYTRTSGTQETGRGCDGYHSAERRHRAKAHPAPPAPPAPGVCHHRVGAGRGGRDRRSGGPMPPHGDADRRPDLLGGLCCRCHLRL